MLKHTCERAGSTFSLVTFDGGRRTVLNAKESSLFYKILLFTRWAIGKQAFLLLFLNNNEQILGKSISVASLCSKNFALSSQVDFSSFSSLSFCYNTMMPVIPSGGDRAGVLHIISIQLKHEMHPLRIISSSE